ncbi:replication initiator protein A domain protein [[Clostridium] nexile DSM 1787]|nr:replication initiator protein A domain protein [[Clostridium] nexile DSM 1787]
MEKIQFDYYRGMEAEQYSFYRVPKILFTAECFKELSCEAKVLYGLLLDRMSLSMKNHWLDEEERVYIIFTVEEIAELLNCGTQKAVKLLKELDSEKGIGLIEKKRLGLGRPNVIYVKNFLVQKNDEENGDMPDLQNCENHNSGVVKTTIQECPKSQFQNDENHNSEDVEPIDIGTEELGKEPYLNGEKEILEDMEIKMQENEEIGEENFQNCENHNSRVMKTTIQEFPKSQFKNDENHNSGVVKTTIQECPKSQSNNTDINKTENNETESSNILSNLIYPEKEKTIDEVEQRNTYREIIRENISYECFQNDTPHAREEVDELVELMVEVMVMPDQGKIRIAGEDKLVSLVKSQFMKLTHAHIEYVCLCLNKNTTKVGNIKSYLLTALYNSIMTINHYYQAEVNHDLYGGGWGK